MCDCKTRPLCFNRGAWRDRYTDLGKVSERSVSLEAAAAPELLALYGTVIASVRNVVEQATARAIPCDAVSQAVEHALTAPRPKTRYLVGPDAKLRALMIKLLPDRISDKVLSWALKLPR